MYARVKVPENLKQWVPLESNDALNQKVFVPLHEIIRGNLHKFYSGMTIRSVTLMRLTRDAEVELEHNYEAEIRGLVQDQIRQRRMNRSSVLSSGGAPTQRSRSCCASVLDWRLQNSMICRRTGLREPV
jgi:polyphosphate kinase